MAEKKLKESIRNRSLSDGGRGLTIPTKAITNMSVPTAIMKKVHTCSVCFKNIATTMHMSRREKPRILDDRMRCIVMEPNDPKLSHADGRVAPQTR